MSKEYVIWGTKNGTEDVVRINGEEVQTSLSKAKKIVAILKKRKEFEKLRIQTIDTENWDIKKSFSNGIYKW